MTIPSISARTSALDLPLLYQDPGRILKGWLQSGPHPGSTAFIEKALVRQVSSSIIGGEPYWKDIPMAFTALKESDYIEGGVDRIDLQGLYKASGAKGTYVFAGHLDIKEQSLYRCILDRLRSVVSISGHAMGDGGIVELEKGLHTVIILADNLPDYPWDQFYIQPRLIPCSRAQAEEVLNLVPNRESEAEVARTEALASIELDPSSFIGTEGFVRAAKTKSGHWWMVDPEGKPFFYQGVTSINRMGTQGGRRALPGDYTSAVEKKYNYAQEGPEAFVKATLSKLDDLGLNGLGSWTHPEFFNRKGFYTTDIVETIRVYPTMKGTEWCDVFDPGWAERVDEVAKAICSPQQKNPWHLGYYTENEITFPEITSTGYDLVGNPIYHSSALSLLQICMDQSTHSHAFKAAWAFVAQRHDGNAKALKAWGVEGDGDESMTLPELQEAQADFFGDAFVDDAHFFAVHFAQQFFKVSYEAIKRHDPNHLVIGCRWAGPPHPDILQAEEPWTDVVSVNNYQDHLFERMDEYESATDLPIIIGEYNWADDGHMSIELPFEPHANLTMEERRIYTAERYLKHLFVHPKVAGWTWYRFVTTNRLNTFRNCGLVNHEDELIEYNARPLKSIVAHALPLRVKWDHSPIQPPHFVDGDYTCILQGSSTREGKARVNKIVFGFRIRNGSVESRLHGYGLQGSVAQNQNGSLSISGQFTDVVFKRGRGEFEAVVTFQHSQSSHFWGHHKGCWSGRHFEAKASAWLEA